LNWHIIVNQNFAAIWYNAEDFAGIGTLIDMGRCTTFRSDDWAKKLKLLTYTEL
jgi:hypothetical protein